MSDTRFTKVSPCQRIELNNSSMYTLVVISFIQYFSRFHDN